MPKKLKLLLKFCVTILLLGIIFKNIPIDDFSKYEFRFNMWYLLPIVVVSLLNVFILTYKWKLIVRLRSIDIPIAELFRFYFLGNFVGLVAPVIGGDGVRAYKLLKYTSEPLHSITSVIWIRLTGMIALMIIAAISLPFVSSSCSTLILPGSIIISVTLLAFFALVKFPQRLYEYLAICSEKCRKNKAITLLVLVLSDILQYCENTYAIWQVLALSFVDHMTRILASYLLSLSLGYNVEFYYFLMFLPIACVIQMIPITIGGVGLREGTYVYLFSKVGLTSVEALALSVFTYVFTVVFYLPGLYLLLSTKGDNTRLARKQG
jgi:uncharacterized protein (TIRG00374 family)